LGTDGGETAVRQAACPAAECAKMYRPAPRRSRLFRRTSDRRNPTARGTLGLAAARGPRARVLEEVPRLGGGELVAVVRIHDGLLAPVERVIADVRLDGRGDERGQVLVRLHAAPDLGARRVDGRAVESLERRVATLELRGRLEVVARARHDE